MQDMLMNMNHSRLDSSNRKQGRLLALLSLAMLGVGLVAMAYFWMKAEEPARSGAVLHTITVVAGNGEPGFRDGVGADARMHKPIRLAPLDATTVVFADINNHAVRALNLKGEVLTLAGGPEREGYLDGPASEARLSSPHGVAVRDDGVIAVAEAGGNMVRLLTPVAGGGKHEYTVSTLAGVAGEGGWRDGGCEQALFSAPHAVVWGARGELYVADIGNARLRMIENGEVTTLGGGDEAGHADGPLGRGSLNYPMDLAVDEEGAVWIADAGSLKVRRWRADVGLDTPFEELTLAMPHGIAVLDDVVVIADLYDHRLLAVDRQSGALTTLAGSGTAGLGEGELNKPAAVLFHSGLLWIADLDNHRIVTCAR